MDEKSFINIGDLVKVNIPFYAFGRFNFDKSKYDLGIVLDKSPKNYKDKFYIVLLSNHTELKITYKSNVDLIKL